MWTKQINVVLTSCWKLDMKFNEHRGKNSGNIVTKAMSVMLWEFWEFLFQAAHRKGQKVICASKYHSLLHLNIVIFS